MHDRRVDGGRHRRTLSVMPGLFVVLLVPLAAVLAPAASAASAASPAAATTVSSDDALMREIKKSVYASNWPEVLRRSEELLRRFPGSPLAPQAEFHRARALARTPGREMEAKDAYRRFIAGHPDEHDRLFTDQAWSALFSLACEGRRRTTPGCAAILSEGIADESLYVSTLAAIRAADAGDPAVRRTAVPVLKRAYDLENDTEIRNEILIALLKIDPRQVPQPPPPPAAAQAPPPGVPPLPSLVKMTIYNKAAKRYDLRINLPVAFAQILVDSLGVEERSALKDSAAKKGVDLDDIFQAIETKGQGRLLDMDAPDTRIEVWIE